MSFMSIPANPVDRIGVTGPLQFNKTSFGLSWSDQPNQTYYIQEYLPKGETSARFNQMLTIHLFDKNVKVEAAVQQKIGELNERKKTDIACNYQVTKSPDGKEYLVDFILSESQKNEMTIAEFNIYRYKEVTIGSKKGIMVYAYSKRSYGAQITPFLKGLKAERSKFMNEMAVTKLPAVKL
jgi:hypothetical protein